MPRYREFTERLAHPLNEELVYWRTVFAILSVHTAFEPNVCAYEMLRERGRLPRGKRSWEMLTRLLAGVKASTGAVIQFAGQKAGYLTAFDIAFRKDSEPFMPNGDGPEGWRDRLDGIKGLARTKASFAVCLADPLGSDVVCIDRHMARLLTGDILRTVLSRKVYDACENEIRALAKGYDAPPFAVQWCLWDAVRGHIEPHACLWRA